ncbi:ABC transporter ATP-binding protein [Luteimonas granuli]|uniref:ABC transporter ATP-binding protein n=1 Tax=Luteimonas granuli TaxID=1176533 RepID=A0A518N346_9GAMM|nr:ABC transporter ATP-binding protein [Luteimonas granuli]QDW66340.1 ABC transporter ATP-binding protein [Luteimonas granuli]
MNTSAPALDVRNVGKTYHLWPSPASRLWGPLLYRMSGWTRWFPALSQRLLAGAQARLHTHRALEGVSFSLERGEALGIIGLNGSGKSTLLQIIAGVLPATTGTVVANGRIAALLELGSGFNPELTGRENVRINAAILGITPAQLRERLDDIIAFADIGEYIDEPVKTYSSGMALRLAFAVQVHIDPDILIVDEALAVGDAAFQAKAMARMEQILARGTTLLFVGHDLNVLRAFCQRGILLEEGRVTAQGLPEDVIEQYLFQVHAKASAAAAADAPVRTDQGFASPDGAILRATLRDGVRNIALRHGDPVDVDVELFADPAIGAAACIVDVLDRRGVPVSGRRVRLPPRSGEGRLQFRIRFQALLQRGAYRVRLRLVDAPGMENARVLARHDGGLSFEVVDDCREEFTGLFPLPASVEFAEAPVQAEGG